MAGREPSPASAADTHAQARAICLRLLASRARTRSELAGALTRKAIPDDVAASVLDKFVELGFVDDEAFAAAWVQSRQSGRGLAGRALAYELRQKGVPDEIARAAITAVDPESELTKARDLVRHKLAGMAGVPGEARYRRLAGMLARKGYSGSLASQVVREALADPQADLGDE